MTFGQACRSAYGSTTSSGSAVSAPEGLAQLFQALALADANVGQLTFIEGSQLLPGAYASLPQA
jgi:hypothetical protein